MKQAIFSGTVISPGMAKAKAFVVGITRLETIPYSPVRDEEVGAELEKLWVAAEISISELQGLMKRVKDQIGDRESRVFEAHLMMLRDRHITQKMADRIEIEKISAESAVVRTISGLIHSLRGHTDVLRRKFASDLNDLGLRMVKNLSPFFTYDKAQDLEEPVVIVSRELTPSVAVRVDRKWVAGFVCETGHAFTHAGILASSMGVCAIAGISDFIQIKNGDLVCLDGRTGKVLLNPGEKALEIFERSYCEYASGIHEAEKLTDVAPRTADGHPISLYANIWMPGDIEVAQALGAQGTGLIRTEFVYLFQNKPPQEEDVYQYHRAILEKNWTGTAHFRLLDVGGETDLPEGLVNPEYTRWNGLKFLIEERNLVLSQMRSVLRASVSQACRIVYPFCENLEELRAANALLDRARADLSARGIEHRREIEVGALVEVPEIADHLDEFLDEVSFVVLGSNDLALRCLGLDRKSELDFSQYRSVTSSFLRIVHDVHSRCLERNKEFYFSGQMAEEPLYLALFIGFGICNFNLGSSAIPGVKRWISTLRLSELQATAIRSLEIRDNQALREYLIREMTPARAKRGHGTRG